MRFSRMKNTALAAVFALCGAVGHAATVTSTLPDYTSPDASWETNGSFDIGRFDFSGVGITAATLSGTFGNAYSPSSSEANLFADGILVGACEQWGDCQYTVDGDELVTWSYSFSASDLLALTDGTLYLSADKLDWGAVAVGALTLNLEYAEVPEPASVALVLAGLAGLGLVRRRRNRS
jgi:hypothetical protein